MDKNHLTESNVKALFNEYFASMCIFAERFLGDYEQARDAVSDVFYKIWIRRKNLGDISNYKSYFYLSVRNHCLDILRNKLRESELSNEYFSEKASEEYFEIECVREEVYRLLDKAISEQPKQTQLVLRLKMQGLKNEEIAKTLGISINSVNTLKTHGYKALRKLLGNKWELCFILFFSTHNNF